MRSVSELAGVELALWVARALGWDQHALPITKSLAWFDDSGCFMECVSAFMPHKDWSQGGPLIEKNRIHLDPLTRGGEKISSEWQAQIWGPFAVCAGPTPLVAAMRALVASAYGDTVPDEEQP